MKQPSRGMALAVTLVLLLGLSLLAVAGLASAVASLALSGFEEQSTLAFEAAEAGIAQTIRLGSSLPEPVPAWPSLFPEVTIRTEIVPDRAAGDTGWPEGFSIGSGSASFRLDHFTIRSEGRAGRGARVRLDQDMAVVATTQAAAP